MREVDTTGKVAADRVRAPLRTEKSAKTSFLLASCVYTLYRMPRPRTRVCVRSCGCAAARRLHSAVDRYRRTEDRKLWLKDSAQVCPVY